jgi:hypothetical protein
MAQQVLQNGGVNAFIFKDDAGGMEPHLQRTSGVRLLVNRVDAESAHQILEAMASSLKLFDCVRVKLISSDAQ